MYYSLIQKKKKPLCYLKATWLYKKKKKKKEGKDREGERK